MVPQHGCRVLLLSSLRVLFVQGVHVHIPAAVLSGFFPEMGLKLAKQAGKGGVQKSGKMGCRRKKSSGATLHLFFDSPLEEK